MKPPLPPSQLRLEIVNVPVVVDMIDVHDEPCLTECVCVGGGFEHAGCVIVNAHTHTRLVCVFRSSGTTYQR